MPSTPNGTSETRRPDPGRGSAAPVSRRRLLAAATATALGTTGLGGSAGTRGVAAVPPSQDEPGYDPDEVIREDVWVETTVDTNDTGEPDRVHVEVARPASTADGERFPVIARPSPYYGEQTHGDTTPEMLYDRSVELAASEAASTGGSTGESGAGLDSPSSGGGGERSETHGGSHRTPAGGAIDSASVQDDDSIGPTPLEERYLPRGYVIAYPASIGVGESTGCYTAAAPETVEGLASVVDWFGGRATAYDSRSGGTPIEADWTTGATGMIGASGNGELANGVATTGVDGLEAIVPQAANNGQYSLFRANGTPISVTPTPRDRIADLASWIRAGTARRDDCEHWVEAAEAGQDRATGDYDDFWHDREFLADATDVEAAVLLTHAVDDRIVKPNQFADWYESLEAADVPTRVWLHRGGHTTPTRDAWFDLLDRWWDHWLKGEDTGVMDEAPVTVDRGGYGADTDGLESHATWPVPGTEPASLRLQAGGGTAGGLTLAESEFATESFVDDPTTVAERLAAADESPNRLRYESPVVGEPVHVSGRVVPSLFVSMAEATVVSAALVEYDAAGGSTVVTRGWADPQNRPSYGEYDDPVAYEQSLRESSPVSAGEPLHVEFPLQATDHVFEPGSRLGLVVYASDRRFTLHPPGETEVSLALEGSSVDVPVAGGVSALSEAFAAEPPEDLDGEGDDVPGFGVGGAIAAIGAATGELVRRRARRQGTDG